VERVPGRAAAIICKRKVLNGSIKKSKKCIMQNLKNYAVNPIKKIFHPYGK
jgi:hypothetical protein